MSATVSCPSPEQIDDLLNNRLSAAAADELRRHLLGCPACRGQHTQQPGETTRYSFLAPPQVPGELGWLGPLRVLGVLGQGGMAVVFDAEDTQLPRRVALKLLRPDLTDAQLRQRFLREARVLASIRSEHVVAIFQVGEINGVPFIAMERLEGMTLDERL